MHSNFRFFLLIFAFFALISCKNGAPAAAIDPDDTLPGREVVAFYPDSTPGIVNYYKLDENGNKTLELTRQIHYYEGKKKYTDCQFKTIFEDSAMRYVKNGPAMAYHQNGNVQTEAFYVDGVENGEYKVYEENGKLYYSGSYDMGKRSGTWQFFHDGKLIKRGQFSDGNCSGEWVEFDLNGKIMSKMLADETTIVCGSCPKCTELLKHQ